jgi:hypothetical protein
MPTLKRLKKIIDQEFGPDNVGPGLVKTRMFDDGALELTIGSRTVCITKTGEVAYAESEFRYIGGDILLS